MLPAGVHFEYAFLAAESQHQFLSGPTAASARMQLAESPLRERSPQTGPQLDLALNSVFAQLPPSFTLTATGTNFVASSVVIFNGATVATTVVNSTQLTVTITSAMIPAAGNYTVQVQTPAGNSGDRAVPAEAQVAGKT